jgi:integrase/recombinase XerD
MPFYDGPRSNLPAEVETVHPTIPGAPQLPMPAILERARARTPYEEFFEARISNPHTRRAYKLTVDRFLDWCDRQGVELATITPAMCGRFRDQIKGSPATKKRALAALRRFFDLLTERHFCLVNPARSTTNVQERVEEGKTPELPPRDVRQLFASIDEATVVGLRDRAILAVMAATGCRVGAVAKLRIGSFSYQGGQWHLRLNEKNAKTRSVPVRHDLQQLVLAYLHAAGIADSPHDHAMFRTAKGRTGKLTCYSPEQRSNTGELVAPEAGAMGPDEMRQMLKRRLVDAGLGRRVVTRSTPGTHERSRTRVRYESDYSPHSFRVMVATDLLAQGKDIHDVAYLLGHSSTRTTQVYDRNKRKVSRNLVESIRVTLCNEP